MFEKTNGVLIAGFRWDGCVFEPELVKGFYKTHSEYDNTFHLGMLFMEVNWC